MNFSEIKELIDVINNSNLAEFKFKKEDFEILIRTDKYEKHKSQPQFLAAPPSVVTPPQPTAAQNLSNGNPSGVDTTPKVEESTSQTQPVDESNGYLSIKSPIVGTFYRSPSPEKGPYVKVGDTIDKGAVVCIIEAMKLFNEIESEVSGTIVKVLVEDAQPVEYDQPLFLVDPKG